MRRLPSLGAISVASVVAVEALALGAYPAGLRVNLSPSLPRGIYRAETAPPRPGSLALVCLPEVLVERVEARRYLRRGRCPSGIPPVGKLVAAAGGDLLEVTPQGIRVRGSLLPASQALVRDAQGGRLPAVPRGAFRIEDGHLWLHGFHPDSLDSRYFGPVPAAAVLATLEPLLLWPGDDASFRMRNHRKRGG